MKVITDLTVTSRPLRPSTAWTAGALFANGGAGAWFDPGPTTAFRSSADLTPCGIGDACGFLLDHSQGAGYAGSAFTGFGATALSDDFSTYADTAAMKAAGWSSATSTGTGDIALVSGAMRLASDGAANRARGAQAFATVSGKTYTVEYSATQTHHFRVGAAENGAQNAETLNAGSGTRTVAFVATAATTYVTWEGFAAPGSEPMVDNISVRELPGNHATQGTAAARPILQQDGNGLYYLELDGVDDFLTVSYGAPLSSLTRAIAYQCAGATFICDDDTTLNQASLFSIANGDLRFGIEGAAAGRNIVGTGGWGRIDPEVVVATSSASGDLTLAGSGSSASGTSAIAFSGVTGASLGQGAPVASTNLSGRIYAFVDVGRVVTAAENTGLQAYLATSSGVTLP